LEERVATRHGTECTRLLRLLAVECPLQTSPVTQLWIRYIHSPLTHWSLVDLVTYWGGVPARRWSPIPIL